MIQTFIFNNNFCRIEFSSTNMLVDGTITNITLYIGKEIVVENVEAMFDYEKQCLKLLTDINIPLSCYERLDFNKLKKLVYIHLTKDNNNTLSNFITKEDYYNR